MDDKRKNNATPQGSSSESSGNSPASPASPSHGDGKAAGANAFANDGSFMELFKKKMEAERRKKESGQASCSESTADQGQSTVEKRTSSVASFVGKRRGGAKLTLKTGVVAKKQKSDPEYEGKGDAWTSYMAEVKKYKAHQCGDDDKTRPLVK
ncbi:telomerase RNA component interacting RNase [Clupea harengus]|uniref:Telomerase RNA component interacting RNase n=1 Tax=Clupea harengus TaxID=7950 RepID=A0A8M1KN41_CLUHA|nr:telomerase RNA component interacting RNase [Clupea harengus]